MAVASKQIPPPDLVGVRRALISVSDKAGLADFAAALSRLGVELISTGGIGQGDRRRRHRRSPMSPRSPAFPKSWTDGSRPCTRASMADCSASATMPSTPRPWSATASRRSICLVVNLYPFEAGALRRRATTPRRSRTSTSAGRRWSAPRPRTTPMSPSSPILPTTPRCSTRWTLNIGSLSLDFRKQSGRQGVCPHRRL